MNPRASFAMMRIRLGDEPSAGFVALALLGLLNAVRPGDSSQSIALAVTMVVGGIALATATTLRRTAVARTTELRLFAAPLYGKEVARAQAIVPCVTTLVLPAVLLLAYHSGAPLGPSAIGGVALGLVAATLVALSGTLRTGRDRTLYLVAALATGWTIALTALALGRTATVIMLPAVAAIVYIALRAFGETLARFDPIDEPR